MSEIWHCSSCFAVARHGETGCPRCGSPPDGAVEGERPEETEPIVLQVPEVDFPITRRRRSRRRRLSWLAPLVLCVIAVGVATGWDPLARRLDAARALGGASAAATEARRDELGRAVADLAGLLDEEPALAAGALPPDWRPRVLAIGDRYRLAGDRVHPELADPEVRLRAVLLDLVALPATPDAPDLAPRLGDVRAELSRVSEDLSHVQ